MFEPGTQVRLKGADEVGVVVRVLGSGQVQVRFADGLKFVSLDDPTTLIHKGRIGESEGYALRLQALYLRQRHDDRRLKSPNRRSLG